MPIEEYLKSLTPRLVLKWATVLFIIVIYLLIVTTTILYMAGVYG